MWLGGGAATGIPAYGRRAAAHASWASRVHRTERAIESIQDRYNCWKQPSEAMYATTRPGAELEMDDEPASQDW